MNARPGVFGKVAKMLAGVALPGRGVSLFVF